MNFDGITSNLTGTIITVSLLLAMVVVVTICIIFLVRGVQDQVKFNKTVLPSLDLEGEKKISEEDDEDSSAFDVDSVFDVAEEDGFESDAWFAKMREDEGRELPAVSSSSESINKDNVNKSSDEFIGDSGLDELMNNDYSEESSFETSYEEPKKPQKPAKKTGLPQL